LIRYSSMRFLSWFLWGLSWSLHFESFTVTAMTLLAYAEHLCHKWPRICSTCRKHSPVRSSFITYHQLHRRFILLDL
jgi:hypothetical protein